MDLASRFAKTPFNFTLKEQQEQALAAILNGKDCIFCQPTGFGKSVIYAAAPLLHSTRSISLIVSPLKALMLDQASKLNALGVPSVCISAKKELSLDDLTGVQEGRFNCVFMTPEAIFALKAWDELILLNKVYHERVCVIAVDEAHVIYEWTADFRPMYGFIGELRSHFTSAPTLILSATFTPQALKYCLDKLGLNQEEVTTVAQLPDRCNIWLEFRQVKSRHLQLQAQLQEMLDDVSRNGEKSSKCIIYVSTPAKAGELFAQLMMILGQKAFRNQSRLVEDRIVDVYHGGLFKEDQERITKEFVKEHSTIRILISTIAFGMGIDITNVRTIVHWGGCKSIMDYWQQMGRAGRDGMEAKSIFLTTAVHRLHYDEDMKKLCCEILSGHIKCVRVAVIEKFVISGMDTAHLHTLAQRGNCLNKCTSCQCSSCLCCSLCKETCPCNN